VRGVHPGVVRTFRSAVPGRPEGLHYSGMESVLAAARRPGATLWSAGALPITPSRSELDEVGRGTVELKAAAAEIENAALPGTPPDRVRQGIKVCAAVFLDLEQTGLTQDAQMLGNVVRRNAEPLRDLADVERLVEQQAHDADPGVLTEGSQRDDAVVPLDDGKCTVAGRKTVQRNRQIRLAGCDHGERNTTSTIRSRRQAETNV
jgi:hypothetical protein